MKKHGLVSFTVLAWGSALLAISGCGKSDPHEYATVSGVITLDQQPFSNASVVFQPRGGIGSTAVCDEKGHFSLKTVQGKAGAAVGKHSVAIYPPQPMTSSKDDRARAPRQTKLPERYNLKTELVFEVPASGSDQANFDLTSR